MEKNDKLKMPFVIFILTTRIARKVLPNCYTKELNKYSRYFILTIFDFKLWY